ncbi:reverse transcriptase [Lasius niger]|uniref:Reverse transcriptase n=1 Tax=Lasius niger TaxID=67767 RepID=A0A0J7KE54_LASNI|nr:reverse transcriptase [Lasius niger]
MQISVILRRIKDLGLTVSASKTNAVIFFEKRKPVWDRPVEVLVGDEPVEVKGSMKYLGVVLDSRMTFRDHFKYVAEKASKVIRALGRLMSNLRRPVRPRGGSTLTSLCQC